MEKFNARQARKFMRFMTAKEEAIYRIHNAIRAASIDMKGECTVSFRNFCDPIQTDKLFKSVADFLKKEGYTIYYDCYRGNATFRIKWCEMISVDVNTVIKLG